MGINWKFLLESDLRCIALMWRHYIVYNNVCLDIFRENRLCMILLSYIVHKTKWLMAIDSFVSFNDVVQYFHIWYSHVKLDRVRILLEFNLWTYPSLNRHASMAWCNSLKYIYIYIYMYIYKHRPIWSILFMVVSLCTILHQGQFNHVFLIREHNILGQLSQWHDLNLVLCVISRQSMVCVRQSSHCFPRRNISSTSTASLSKHACMFYDSSSYFSTQKINTFNYISSYGPVILILAPV